MEILDSKTDKQEDREKRSALELAEKTINSLGDIQKKLDDREITQNEFFTTVSETIKDAIKELSEAVQQRPGITVETDPIAQIVNQALETFSSTLVEIKTACENIKLPDIKNEFRPDLKIPSPTVVIDITPLEILLRDELPKAFKGLLDGLKFPKPASNKGLEDQLKKVIDLLGKIKDKKSPMFIGGGGGGGNTPTAPWQGGNAVPVITGGLIPERWDDLVLTYTGSNLTGVVYYFKGGVAATLELTYTGSKLDRVRRV